MKHISFELLKFSSHCFLLFFSKNDKNKKSSSTKSGREQAITRILLLMSFAFLLFTAGCMFFLYTSVIYLGPQLDGGDPWVGQMYVAMAQLQVTLINQEYVPPRPLEVYLKYLQWLKTKGKLFYKLLLNSINISINSLTKLRNYL